MNEAWSTEIIWLNGAFEVFWLIKIYYMSASNSINIDKVGPAYDISFDKWYDQCKYVTAEVYVEILLSAPFSYNSILSQL